MSEDPTKDIGQKYETKPTLETVVQMLGEFRTAMEKRFDALEEQTGIRLDRIESEVKKTHSEFYEMRADFRELRRAVLEHFKEPA